MPKLSPNQKKKKKRPREFNFFTFKILSNKFIKFILNIAFKYILNFELYLKDSWIFSFGSNSTLNY